MLQETKKPGGVSKNEVQFETLNDTKPHSQNFVMVRSASTPDPTAKCSKLP